MQQGWKHPCRWVHAERTLSPWAHSEDPLILNFSYFAGHLGYPDTEYEYFEQRGGLARPNYLSATPMVPTMGPGAPLLPTETAKIDSRHEEVSFLAKKRSKRLLKSITDGTYLEVIALDPGNWIPFCHISGYLCRITLDAIIIKIIIHGNEVYESCLTKYQ